MPRYRARRRRAQRVHGWQLQPVARGRARSTLHRIANWAMRGPGTITDAEYRRSVTRPEAHFGIGGLYDGEHRAHPPRELAVSAKRVLPSAMLVGCCGSSKKKTRKRKKSGLLVGLARTFSRKKNRR